MAATVSGVAILDRPSYTGHVWDLPVSIDAGVSSTLVPASTRWVVSIESTYPFGAIEVYPAADGISATFPHQEPNLPADGKRSGKICVDSPYGRRALARPRNDPIGDADHRLAWYLARAREWIIGAATDALVEPGDPFEVPRVASLSSVSLIRSRRQVAYAAI